MLILSISISLDVINSTKVSSLKKAGITEDTVRLSIGIEDINDLKEDLDEALKRANR